MIYKSQHSAFIDIETAPLPDAELNLLMPEFEPDARLKDLTKIAESIAAKQSEWKDKSALRSTTGRIVAITVASEDEPPVVGICLDATSVQLADKTFSAYKDEQSIIADTVELLSKYIATGNSRIFTWNGHGFDLPFICQRASKHGIPAFKLLTDLYRGRVSWHESFIDAMQVFTMQYARAEGFGLDAVSKMMGGSGKLEGGGKDFHKTLMTDPDKAIAYAAKDVTDLRDIVHRMGLA